MSWDNIKIKLTDPPNVLLFNMILTIFLIVVSGIQKLTKTIMITIYLKCFLMSEKYF